jgi:hypothetical protein
MGKGYSVSHLQKLAVKVVKKYVNWIKMTTSTLCKLLNY